MLSRYGFLKRAEVLELDLGVVGGGQGLAYFACGAYLFASIFGFIWFATRNWRGGHGENTIVKTGG